jgi:hypothetical protein
MSVINTRRNVSDFRFHEAHGTGFSLRDNLIFEQGCKTKEELQAHLNRVYETIKEIPSVKVSKYRITSKQGV